MLMQSFFENIICYKTHLDLKKITSNAHSLSEVTPPCFTFLQIPRGRLTTPGSPLTLNHCFNCT